MELTRLSRCPGPARGQGCPPLGSLSWKQQDKPSDHRPLPGGPQRAAEQDAAASWSHWTIGDKSSGTQMVSELSRQWKQEPCSLEKLMQWLGRGSDVLWRWTHQVQWRILPRANPRGSLKSPS